MPIQWEQESSDLLVVHISGKILFSEFSNCQLAMEPILQAQGKMNYLVILQDFAGWDEDDGWNDMSFIEKNDQYLSRFAIVGNEEWKDEALVFMMAGLRPVDIRYFTSIDEARQWLAGSS